MMITNSTNMVQTFYLFFAEKCKILPPGTPWKQSGPPEGTRTVILSSNGTTDSIVLSFEFLQLCINGRPALLGPYIGRPLFWAPDMRWVGGGGTCPACPPSWLRHCFFYTFTSYTFILLAWFLSRCFPRHRGTVSYAHSVCDSFFKTLVLPPVKGM